MTRPRILVTAAAILLVVPAITLPDLPGLLAWIVACWALAGLMIWALKGSER